MRILIAEDDKTSSFILERTLEKEGFEVVAAPDGQKAFELISNDSNFDALLTDWMMPNLDGISLIRKVRSEIKKQPLIIVITALSSPEARVHALDSGADEYIAKPIYPVNVIEVLKRSLSRKEQIFASRKRTLDAIPAYVPVKTSVTENIHAGVMIGASSGGPLALKTLFENMKPLDNVIYCIVLHGPGWMLETFAETLANHSKWKVHLAQHGTIPKPGEAYLAPGDVHLKINSDPLQLVFDDSEPENYVKPAVDVLFRSAAAAFGKRCVVAVLTGMGCDGAAGSLAVKQAGGVVLIQDPETALIRSMPDQVAEQGIVTEAASLENLGSCIRGHAKIILKK